MTKYLTKSELFAVVLNDPLLQAQTGIITLPQLLRRGYTASVGNLYVLHVYRLNEWKLSSGRMTRQDLKRSARKWYGEYCKHTHIAVLDCEAH